MAWYAPPARALSAGGEPELAEQLGHGDGPDPQRAGQRQPLGIDRVHHPGDRWPAAVGVEAELACGGLDPARVAHHPGRVQDRVEVRQVGLEHAVCLAELARQQRVQPLMAGLQAAGRERGDRRPAAQEYPDRGRAGQPADVRGGGQLADRALTRPARASSAARYSAPPLWPGFSQISWSLAVARARAAA